MEKKECVFSRLSCVYREKGMRVIGGKRKYRGFVIVENKERSLDK